LGKKESCPKGRRGGRTGKKKSVQEVRWRQLNTAGRRFFLPKLNQCLAPEMVEIAKNREEESDEKRLLRMAGESFPESRAKK